MIPVMIEKAFHRSPWVAVARCSLFRKHVRCSGLSITVAHHPPGTSKWNRIEHRLFAFITQNWRGKPLISHEVIVQLIGATSTSTGLDVQCRFDENDYPKGIKVSDAEMNGINIDRDSFHGEWNYTISPALAVSDDPCGTDTISGVGR